MTDESLDPGADVALFVKTSTELRAFARAFEKGSHTTVPLPALSAAIERLEALAPLDEFRRLAVLVAKAAPTLGVKADELDAHWKLAFFRRRKEPEALLAHAAEITTASVKEHVAPAVEARAEAKRCVAELAKRSPGTDAYQEWTEAHQIAANASKTATVDLFKLVGAPGEPFDPKRNYLDEWKRAVRVSEALAGVGHRGVDPDATTAKAFRAKRGWTQAQLVDQVRENTETKLSIRTIRRLEAGKRVDVRTLEAIAKALGTSLTTLLL